MAIMRDRLNQRVKLGNGEDHVYVTEGQAEHKRRWDERQRLKKKSALRRQKEHDALTLDEKMDKIHARREAGMGRSQREHDRLIHQAMDKVKAEVTVSN